MSHFPGEAVGTVIAGLVLTSSGGDYSKVAYYSGGVMLAASFAIIPARLSRERKFWAKF